MADRLRGAAVMVVPRNGECGLVAVIRFTHLTRLSQFCSPSATSPDNFWLMLQCSIRPGHQTPRGGLTIDGDPAPSSSSSKTGCAGAIDATHLKAHRSRQPSKKACSPTYRTHEGRPEGLAGFRRSGCLACRAQATLQICCCVVLSMRLKLMSLRKRNSSGLNRSGASRKGAWPTPSMIWQR